MSYGPAGILGQQANRDSTTSRSALSGDGRFSVFSTASNNLVANDSGRRADVFVFDAWSGTLTRISERPDGDEANGDSEGAVISADGRWIAFVSRATDLVAGVDAPTQGVYLHDRQSRLTQLLTPDAGSYDESGSVAISADGSVVAFSSWDQLVVADTDTSADGYAWHRGDGKLSLLTRRADGAAIGVISNHSTAISADGRYVSFGAVRTVERPAADAGVFVADLATGELDRVQTMAGDSVSLPYLGPTSLSGDGRFVAVETSVALSPLDINGNNDIYLFDRISREFELVSVGSNGALSDGVSWLGVVSLDGSTVAFLSTATNLHPGTTGQASLVYVRHRIEGRTVLMSRSLDGQASSSSDYASPWISISADASTLAFASTSDALVKSDLNQRRDAFVVDIASRTTRLASVSPETPRIAGSSSPFEERNGVHSFVSADGSVVLFNSAADNLTIERVGGVFRYDVRTGVTSRIPTWHLPADSTPHVLVAEGLSSDGTALLYRRAPRFHDLSWEFTEPDSPWDLWLHSPTRWARVDDAPQLGPATMTKRAVMSGDANRIAFHSGSTSSNAGIYVRDTSTWSLRRVDRNADGADGNAGAGHMLGFSRNGRFVAFTSRASNLVPENAQGRLDMYLADLDAGTLERIVHPQTGASLVQFDFDEHIAISDDGRILAFVSNIQGLTPSFLGTGVFRLDRAQAMLSQLSPAMGDGYCDGGAISMTPDGSKLAFRAYTEFDLFDSIVSEIFIHDAVDGTLMLASSDGVHAGGDGESGHPSLNADASSLSFTSTSQNWDSTPRVAGDLAVFQRSLDGATLFRSGFE